MCSHVLIIDIVIFLPYNFIFCLYLVSVQIKTKKKIFFVEGMPSFLPFVDSIMFRVFLLHFFNYYSSEICCFQ